MEELRLCSWIPCTWLQAVPPWPAVALAATAHYRTTKLGDAWEHAEYRPVNYRCRKEE